MTHELTFSDHRLLKLGAAFEASGRRVRVVGGAVRDMLSGRTPKDLDIATTAMPEETMEIGQSAGFRVIPTGLQHGTVTLVVEGEPFEVTTLRQDLKTDGRHAEVGFVRDFRTDAMRRDFTINAMSASLDGRLFDYFGGRDDLEAGRVRFVGIASHRINEDYLRILRFFRFQARFGDASPDRDAVEAISALHAGLEHISGERIWQEMRGILSHPGGAAQIDAMGRLGVLGSIGIRGPQPMRLAAAEAVRAHGGSAAACLGTLIGDRVDEVADLWRISNGDRDQALLASAIIKNPETAPLHWLGEAALNGMDAEVAAVVLSASGRSEAASALLSGVPSFPLKGRDLLEVGVSPGPSVGRILARAKAAWRASGFRMNADQLLENEGLGPYRSPAP